MPPCPYPALAPGVHAPFRESDVLRAEGLGPPEQLCWLLRPPGAAGGGYRATPLYPSARGKAYQNAHRL
eukprot:6180628-Pleurochrysis_carterae.AAC.5